MKPKNLLRWAGCLTLLFLTACGHAATNNPGTIFLPGSVPYDHDATNFVGRAGIPLYGSEAKAIGRLVNDLKRANIWTNLYAFYPFVGGTSNSCAQNLVATNYPVSWNGTVVFSPNGVTGDGVSASGDTGFIESNTGANTNNLHVYAYASDVQSVYSGAYVGSGQATAWGSVGETSGNFAGMNLNAQDSPNSLGSFGTGDILASRSSTNQNFLLSWPMNATTNIALAQSYITNGVATTGIVTNSIKLLGNPQVGNGVYMQGFTKTTLGAVSFGKYLSYNQATNLFCIVNRFRSALNHKPQTLAP